VLLSNLNLPIKLFTFSYFVVFHGAIYSIIITLVRFAVKFANVVEISINLKEEITFRK